MKCLGGESSSNVAGVNLSGTAPPAANSHTGNNKDLCKCIQQLSVSSSKNNVNLGDSEDDQVFVSHLTPKEKKTVAKLISSKCLIHCHMNGVESAVLLDTGAQVSIVSKQFVDLNFPSLQSKRLENFLDRMIN